MTINNSLSPQENILVSGGSGNCSCWVKMETTSWGEPVQACLNGAGIGSALGISLLTSPTPGKKWCAGILGAILGCGGYFAISFTDAKPVPPSFYCDPTRNC